jgi:hypothetical protein
MELGLWASGELERELEFRCFKRIVEEELEVSLWRLNVWFEDFVYVL